MTDRDHTTVTDARGPVNTGPGDQYVIYAATDRLIRRRAESLRISRDDRLHLADRFVPPARYRIAADLLEEPGSVVLVNGRPGSGRRAAAIMLLHRFGEDRNVDEEGVRVEELPVTGKDRDAGSDEDEVSPGRGTASSWTSPGSPTRRSTARPDAAWPGTVRRYRRRGPTWSSSCRGP
ncbi:hypothetical protein ACN6AT_13940 [Streptomyces sp. JL4002]|uniref:hypothetical protein n=1 Tax=Streptomyces sp. JL4002 TaxID=3404781 RepID=UPI003B287405